MATDPLATRRRRVRWLQRYVLNPPAVASTWLGLVPGHALIETHGRRTGRCRWTVVGLDLDPDSDSDLDPDSDPESDPDLASDHRRCGPTGWIVTEQGRHAGYVRNLEADPRVRIRTGRRWHRATARIVDGDDAEARLDGFHRPGHAVAVRRFGTDLLTVRLELGAWPATEARVDPGVLLWWIPVGAGGHVARRTSRWWETVVAARQHRAPRPLVHAALEVVLDGTRTVIEMAPAWGGRRPADRGVVGTGPVGLAGLGRLALFRYEVRCWQGGTLPDRDEAIGPPTVVPGEATARAVLAAAPDTPTPTWGRPLDGGGDMWSSNSVASWLLATAGVDPAALGRPPGTRAPGWQAGIDRTRHP